MGVYSTKSSWQRALRSVVAFCVRKNVPPDAFTFGAMAVSLAAGFAFPLAEAQRAWLWVIPPCTLIRLLFNLMDGLLARERGLADTWGEVKNEFGDRIEDALFFLGLGFSSYVDIRLATLALALILLVSYLGIFGKALTGKRVYVGVFAKGDRMLSLGGFTLYAMLSGNLASYDWYLGFACFAALITIVQRLRTIHHDTQPPA